MRSDRPPRILLHVEDIEFAEFLYGELSYGDFAVDRVFTRREAFERLQAEDYPVYVAPIGWSTGRDPELDELLELRRVFALPAEGFAPHPEPRALVPLLKRFVERQRLLDDALARVLHFQSGLCPKDAKLRLAVDVPVQFEFLDVGEGTGRTVNLSPAGFFVALKAEEALPRPEEVFLFRITAPESRLSPIEGSARVRWVCDGATGKTPTRGFFRARIGFGAEILPRASREAAWDDRRRAA